MWFAVCMLYVGFDAGQWLARGVSTCVYICTLCSRGCIVMNERGKATRQILEPVRSLLCYRVILSPCSFCAMLNYSSLSKRVFLTFGYNLKLATVYKIWP